MRDIDDLDSEEEMEVEGPLEPSPKNPPKGYLNESLILFDRHKEYPISEAHQIHNSITFKINSFVTNPKCWLVYLYIRKIKSSARNIPTSMQGDIRFKNLEEVLSFVERICEIRGYATRRSSTIASNLSFETSCLYQQLATFVSLLIAEQNWQTSIDIYHQNFEERNVDDISLYNIVDDKRKIDIHESVRTYKRQKGFKVIHTDENGDVTLATISKDMVDQLVLKEQDEPDVTRRLTYNSSEISLNPNPANINISAGESLLNNSRRSDELLKLFLPKVESGELSVENCVKMHQLLTNSEKEEKDANITLNDKKTVQFSTNNVRNSHNSSNFHQQNLSSRNTSPRSTNNFQGNSFGFSPISNVSTNHVTTVLQNVNIKDFDGNINDSEKAKDWLRKFNYTAHMANWDNIQRVESFKVHLVGSAKHWFNRQKPSIQNDWISLHDLFKTKFCSHDITMRSKYFEMRNKPNELISDYFNRLSVAAIQAEIYFEDNEKDKLEHMRQFYNTIYDRELAKGLSMRACTSISELEFVISTIEQTARLDKIAQHHENKKKKVQFQQNSNESHNFNGNKSRSDQRNDNRPRVNSFSVNDNVKNNSRAKDQDSDKKCSHCNKPGHVKENCFRLMKCSYCKRTGHPLQYCSQRARDLVSVAEQIVNDPTEGSKLPDKMKKFFENGSSLNL